MGIKRLEKKAGSDPSVDKPDYYDYDEACEKLNEVIDFLNSLMLSPTTKEQNE